MARAGGSSHEVRAMLRYLATPEHAQSVREEVAQLAAGIVRNTPCGGCGASPGTACAGLTDAVHVERATRYALTGWPIPC